MHDFVESAASFGAKTFSTFSDDELQIVFLSGLCCLGFCVVVSTILQILKTILWLWPLALFVLALTVMPQLRMYLVEKLIPTHINEIGDFVTKMLNKTIPP